MTKLLCLALLLLCGTNSMTDGLKILGLFPHPAISHYQFFQPIMRGLAEAGHDVTVISHFPDKSPPAHYKDLVLPSANTLMNTVDLQHFIKQQSFYSHISEFFLLLDWGIDHCNATLKSKALLSVLKDRHKVKYDVIITEQFNSDCMMGVAHVLQAPVIALSSCAIMPWYYDRYSIPMNPSYNPALFFGQSENMNFLERLGNWITHHSFNIMYKYYNTPAADALIHYKFGHDVPSTADLGRETSLLFVNQHFSLSGARALSPQVIELGGIHIQKSKPLPADIQRFLDSADNGVIYISWGSMIRAETLPHEKREGILKAIRRLKQKVIWKFENETLANKPDNLLISKWLPQREILCHPNVKAFMTHGGLMGTSEAAYCGVATVVTPIYGDQFLNANAMKNREMGVVLKFDDINENSVFKSLKTVLDKKYQDNAKSVSSSYKHRPQQALDTAIWWVEYVAKTQGGPLLKSPARNMSPFVYYCLDIYLFFAVLALTLLVLGKVVLKKVFAKNLPGKKVKSH